VISLNPPCLAEAPAEFTRARCSRPCGHGGNHIDFVVAVVWDQAGNLISGPCDGSGDPCHDPAAPTCPVCGTRVRTYRKAGRHWISPHLPNVGREVPRAS